MGCPEYRHVLVDIGDDLFDLVRPVPELDQRTWDRLVDDRHRAAADELLGLDQSEVGLDPGGVTVHEQADGARGRQNRRLRIAQPNSSASSTASSHASWAAERISDGT